MKHMQTKHYVVDRHHSSSVVFASEVEAMEFANRCGDFADLRILTTSIKPTFSMEPSGYYTPIYW